MIGTTRPAHDRHNFPEIVAIAPRGGHNLPEVVPIFEAATLTAMTAPTGPTVTAVVLAWQAEPWLRRGVEALLASEKVAADVVLVDNGCTTDDVEVLEQLPGVTVVR